MADLPIEIQIDIPTTQLNVGGAINAGAESYNLTTGTQSSGTVNDTAALDSTHHEHTDTAGAMDLYYQFDVGGDGRPVSITITGRLNGANDDLEVHAYNWGGVSWDQIGVMDGKNGSADEVFTFTLFANHVGTGANIGKVRVRFTDGAFTLTSATLRIDQIYISYAVVSRTVGYGEGAIWIDTNGSNTNTEPYVDGVADNPVSTWAAFLTLSASLNINNARVIGGSSIALTGNSDRYELVGNSWTLDLNGQSIDNAYIEGATVSGTYSGTPIFDDCQINDITGPPAEFHDCGLGGDIIANAIGDWFFHQCHSNIAGTATPSFDYGLAVGNTNFNMRDYSGGIEFKNMGQAGVDVASLEGQGQFVLSASCTGGTLVVRGAFEKTDNSGGAVSITEVARFGTDQLALTVAGIDAIFTRAFSAIETANPSSTTDRNLLQSLRALRNLWQIVDTTLTVMQEDDATAAWTGTVTKTAGADPVTKIDPV